MIRKPVIHGMGIELDTWNEQSDGSLVYTLAGDPIQLDRMNLEELEEALYDLNRQRTAAPGHWHYE